jgi:hypothetical protein
MSVPLVGQLRELLEQLPADVLTASQRLCLMLRADFAQHAISSPSEARMARAMGCTRARAIEATNVLKIVGLLRVEKTQTGRPTKFRVLAPPKDGPHYDTAAVVAAYHALAAVQKVKREKRTERLRLKREAEARMTGAAGSTSAAGHVDLVPPAGHKQKMNGNSISDLSRDHPDLLREIGNTKKAVKVTAALSSPTRQTARGSALARERI